MFLETLDKGIEESIQGCPDAMPTLNLGELDFSALEAAEDNFWLRLIFLRDDSVKAHQKDIVEQYCSLINECKRGGSESFPQTDIAGNSRRTRFRRNSNK